MSQSTNINLTTIIENAATKVKIGSTYYHYKNPNLHYKVLHIGLKSTEQPCVIYQSQTNPELIWIKSCKKWCDQIIYENKIVPRFTLVIDK